MKEFTPIFAATLLVMFLGGCSSVDKHAAGLDPDRYHRTVRVACVGDSITYGAGVENRETNNYPAVLGRLLGPKFETGNFGVSGATLLKKGDKPYWNEPAFKAVDEYAPDAVVLKLGTNDSKPQNWKYGSDFEQDLQAMIRHFESLPSHPRIWLCLPVPVYQTNWGINEPVVKGEIIPKIRKVAVLERVPVIDLYSALSHHPEMFPDMIHPNAAGARVIARTVQAALTAK
jgi:acyl-CoA thioesterase-1